MAEVNAVDVNSSPAARYLDSGVSNHVIGSSTVFPSLVPSSGTKITSAGGQGHIVTGLGNVAIRLPNGAIQKIDQVLVSPKTSYQSAFLFSLIKVSR